MIGERLDKYDVVEKIGEGGMATVYKAVHSSLKRVVAIKVLHPHLSSSERNRKRFAREARTIEQLEHENVLRIFDYSGSLAENCYIVTEYVEGQTLQELMQEEGFLSSEIVSLICLQLAHGLRYAHEAGVIHRDIKPENVMVRHDGVVKLMDFGIAKFLEEVSVTLTGSLIGSPAYMSPESVLEGKPDQRSDLFSLGSLMFYMLSGQVPFSGNNPSVVLKKVIEGDRPDLIDIVPSADHRLATLIEQLLHPDVELRIQSAKLVEEVLEDTIASTLGSPLPSEWQVSQWLSNKAEYTASLNLHLEEALLAIGRESLANGRPLDAQKQFNRLLSIAPDNPEVMDLMVGLSQRSDGSRLRKWTLIAGALVALCLTIFAMSSPWSGSAAEIVANNVIEPPSGTITEDASNLERDVELSEGEVTEPIVVEPAIVVEIEQPVAEPVDSETPIVPTETMDAQQVQLNNVESVVLDDALASNVALQEEASQASAILGTINIGLDPANRGVWADVYVDGNSVGRLRAGGSPHVIEVAPGPHVIQVSNDYAITHVEEIELAPGATVDMLNINLLRRPVTVRFPVRLDMNCQVLNGDTVVGTLQSLGFAARLNREELLSEIRIVCPNGVTLGPYDIRQPLPGEAVNFPP